MSEIGFHRCERTRAVSAVYLGQTGIFDGVTHRRAGTVRLHHPYGVGVHVRRSQCRTICRDLRGARRRGDVDGAAILIGRRAAHHREDPVTVPQGVGQPLEQDHRATFGGDEPVRRDVERMAGSARGQHALCRARRGLAGLELHRDAACQGKVTFALVQAAAGHVHGGEPEEHAVSTVSAGP